MQVLPQYSQYTCKELRGPFGVEGGAQALRKWMRGRSMPAAIYRYNCGYADKKRCRAYKVDILKKLGSLKRSPLQTLITG